MKKHWLLSFGLLCLSACCPDSLEDFQHEGDAFCRKLCEDLKKIHSREELLKAEPHLKKHFESLVDLMIAAREYQQKHPEEMASEPNLDDHPSSKELLEELKRIYAMENGQEVIEKAQREALIRLDAFERTLYKQKQSLPK